LKIAQMKNILFNSEILLKLFKAFSVTRLMLKAWYFLPKRYIPLKIERVGSTMRCGQDDGGVQFK